MWHFIQEGCRLAKRSLRFFCQYIHNTLKNLYLCKSTFFMIQQDSATEFLKMNFILSSSRFFFLFWFWHWICRKQNQPFFSFLRKSWSGTEVLRPVYLSKWDSGAVVFLKIWTNFPKKFFCRAAPRDCFWVNF